MDWDGVRHQLYSDVNKLYSQYYEDKYQYNEYLQRSYAQALQKINEFVYGIMEISNRYPPNTFRITQVKKRTNHYSDRRGVLVLKFEIDTNAHSYPYISQEIEFQYNRDSLEFTDFSLPPFMEPVHEQFQPFIDKLWPHPSVAYRAEGRCRNSSRHAPQLNDCNDYYRVRHEHGSHKFGRNSRY
jgi:hypothetical protein